MTEHVASGCDKWKLDWTEFIDNQCGARGKRRLSEKWCVRTINLVYEDMAQILASAFNGGLKVTKTGVQGLRIDGWLIRKCSEASSSVKFGIESTGRDVRYSASSTPIARSDGTGHCIKGDLEPVAQVMNQIDAAFLMACESDVPVTSLTLPQSTNVLTWNMCR